MGVDSLYADEQYEKLIVEFTRSIAASKDSEEQKRLREERQVLLDVIAREARRTELEAEARRTEAEAEARRTEAEAKKAQADLEVERIRHQRDLTEKIASLQKEKDALLSKENRTAADNERLASTVECQKILQSQLELPHGSTQQTLEVLLFFILSFGSES